jgi:hypothetical protein
MVKIYSNNASKTYLSTIVPEKLFSGTNVYNNNEGKTVLTESWTSATTNVTTPNNFKSYIDTSNIQIENLPKLNGTYISNYVFNDNYVNQTQKELVVYYIGVTNKCHIKVTYLDFFTKVIIKRVK